MGPGEMHKERGLDAWIGEGMVRVGIWEGSGEKEGWGDGGASSLGGGIGADSSSLVWGVGAESPSCLSFSFTDILNIITLKIY